MNPNTPTGAIVVVLSCAFVCAILVSATTVTLRPIQEQNQLIERSRNIVMLSGLVPVDQPLSGDEVLAALHPADTKALYFVSKGDGTHHFSETLEEHNDAVARYQLKGRKKSN